MSQELKEPLGPGSLGRLSMEAAENSTNNMGLLETRVYPHNSYSSKVNCDLTRENYVLIGENCENGDLTREIVILWIMGCNGFGGIWRGPRLR
jgi:hypothetical protein